MTGIVITIIAVYLLQSFIRYIIKKKKESVAFKQSCMVCKKVYDVHMPNSGFWDNPGVCSNNCTRKMNADIRKGF